MPAAYRVVSNRLRDMGGVPSIRMAERKDGPVITDNNNFLLEVAFKEISDPKFLEKELNSIPGVIENGIFSGYVDEVLVGTPEGVKVLKKG